MNETVMWVAAVVLLIAASWLILRKKSGRPVPDNLRVGQPLPDFVAIDEQGDPVRSTDLAGSATVMLFVRGSWCPFCSSQVKNLTTYYKNIVDLGGKLIFVTPKPLETTRRVAQFFEVEFDFWLDESLAIAKQLGLLHQLAVPAEFNKEYGGDSVWPTTLVIDPAGIIRFVELSKQISDRPDPKVLLGALRRAIGV